MSTGRHVPFSGNSPGTQPVLRVQPGDTGRDSDGIRPDALYTIEQEVKDRGPGGHILTGPIFIEGAEPGDTLEVRILEIRMDVPYSHN